MSGPRGEARPRSPGSLPAEPSRLQEEGREGGRTRILVLQNRFLIGGQERQTVLHLATIDRRRWEPIVACLRREGEHLEDLERIGIHLESLGIEKLLRAHTVRRVLQLALRVRAEGIALVHGSDFYTDLIGVAVARLAGVPSVVTRVDLGHALRASQREALAAVSRAATRVLVNARCIGDRCLAEGVARDRIAVVRNGIDLERFDAEAAPAPAGLASWPAGPTVIQVANMHHEVKGQDDLLRAMREVAQDVPGVELLFVGDGQRRASLEAMARDNGLGARCRFLGWRRDVPALLARATVAVSASHAEGLSNAIIEAMAARRPVVATAVGGTPELVREGQEGFLVAAGAPGSIAARLRQLLGNPELARRMGEAGRERVARELGVEAMRRSYEALYEGVLGEARP
jgi:glycosyltransferase involved in cell wall biosynthesis